jgi:hypothetical protein
MVLLISASQVARITGVDHSTQSSLSLVLLGGLYEWEALRGN